MNFLDTSPTPTGLLCELDPLNLDPAHLGHNIIADFWDLSNWKTPWDRRLFSNQTQISFKTNQFHPAYWNTEQSVIETSGLSIVVLLKETKKILKLVKMFKAWNRLDSPSIKNITPKTTCENIVVYPKQ